MDNNDERDDRIERAELLAAVAVALTEQIAEHLHQAQVRILALESVLRRKGMITGDEVLSAAQAEEISADADAALDPRYERLRQFDRGRLRQFSVSKLRRLLRTLEKAE